MEKDDNGTVKFDNQVTLTPFTDTGKEGDIVDVVRQIISGENPKKELERLATNDAKESDETEEEENADDVEKKPKTKKNRNYTNTVSKVTDGRKTKKSSEGVDGRTKSFKETMKRINKRRNRNKHRGLKWLIHGVQQLQTILINHFG